MLTMTPRKVPFNGRRLGRPPLLQSKKELARALDCLRYQQTNDVTIEEAATHFDVSWRTVYRWNRMLRGDS